MSFYCPCGIVIDTGDPDEDFRLFDSHEPPEGSCCNCGGRRCMSCVFREMHDYCEDDCPSCCNERIGGPDE